MPDTPGPSTSPLAAVSYQSGFIVLPETHTVKSFVWRLYRGSNLSDDDEGKDPDDGARYVFLGDGFLDRYMLVGDLAKRVESPEKYQADLNYDLKCGPQTYHIWDSDGDESVWLPSLIAPPKGRKRGSGGHWANTDVDTERQEKIWQDVAKAVVKAKPPAKKSNFSIQRFWSPSESDSKGITLYFEPHMPLNDKQLKLAVDEAVALSDTKITCNVVLEGEGKGPNSDRKLISVHYLHFYSAYISSTDLEKLKRIAPGGLIDRALPTGGATGTGEAAEALLAKKLAPEKITAELVTSLTAKKIGGASGMRQTKGVKDQISVMGKSATKLGELFWPKDAPLADVNGSKAVEWLHRSAFSFGGLEQSTNYKTSQNRKNFVFGTSEANTMMIRPEETIKRIVIAEDVNSSTGGRAIVKSVVFYPTDPTHSWMEQKKYTWLAPEMEYSFTCKRKGLNQDFNAIQIINTFHRWIPLKLEAILDLKVDEQLFPNLKKKSG